MQRKNIKSVLEKIRLGSFTSEEEMIGKYWIHQLNPEKKSEYSDEDLERISNEMWDTIGKEGAISPARTIRIWPRILTAAAVVAVLFGAGLFYHNLKSNKPDQIVYKNDVAPGKSGATLTLANGKSIKLTEANNGELAEEAGVVITKSDNGQLIYEIKSHSGAANTFNTLSTAIGETYKLRLPDGTFVWLNASSRLTYTAKLLEEGKRSVKLEGEGYFEVAKDKSHPFVVESRGQRVEVLGTHFNVNAYHDEPVIKTTLLEGRVRVTQHNESKQLKPGEQSINTGNHIIINKADTELAIAWKNNKFIFDSQHIDDIMRMISRWYNVEVIYTSEISKETFWGSISRFDNVSQVLKKLESTEKVHFKIEGRKIYVSP